MRKIFIIGIMVFLSVFAFGQKKTRIVFNSVDLNGKPVTEKIFSNKKLTMLNVWGTFCPPCIREMPDLAALNKANAEKKVAVIGIPIDIVDRDGMVNPLLKKDAEKIIVSTGADYLHVVPSGEMFSGFLRNVQAVPATFFVDSDGNIVGKMYLGAKSEAEWQKIIDKVLKNIKAE
ncbi:MAG: TlpA family protein disulfide reductase [Treponema sp.]|nr:TlpA family protein disulfide reductase [Treponema sp.]